MPVRYSMLGVLVNGLANFSPYLAMAKEVEKPGDWGLQL